MPFIHDIYGLAETELSGEPARLAAALGVAWDERSSSYRGRCFKVD